MSDATYMLPLDVQIAALNRSTKDVYSLIKRKIYRVSDLQKKTNYSARTVRTALRQLMELNLIERIPNLTDMRSCYYKVTLPA